LPARPDKIEIVMALLSVWVWSRQSANGVHEAAMGARAWARVLRIGPAAVVCRSGAA